MAEKDDNYIPDDNEMAETPQQNEKIQTSRTLHYCQEQGNRYTQIEMQLLCQAPCIQWEQY